MSRPLIGKSTNSSTLPRLGPLFRRTNKQETKKTAFNYSEPPDKTLEEHSYLPMLLAAIEETTYGYTK